MCGCKRKKMSEKEIVKCSAAFWGEKKNCKSTVTQYFYFIASHLAGLSLIGVSRFEVCATFKTHFHEWRLKHSQLLDFSCTQTTSWNAQTQTLMHSDGIFMCMFIWGCFYIKGVSEVFCLECLSRSIGVGRTSENKSRFQAALQIE